MTTFGTGRQRNDRKSTMYRKKGFTLVELMITVAVLGIILSVAVPQLKSYILKNRFNGAVIDMLGAFREARSTAVERNSDIVFQINTRNRTYQAFMDDGAGSADNNNDGIPDNADNNSLDTGEKVILTRDLPDGVTFASASFGGNAHFHFDGRGFPLDDDGVLTSGLVALQGPPELHGLLGDATIQLIASGHSLIASSHNQVQ